MDKLPLLIVLWLISVGTLVLCIKSFADSIGSSDNSKMYKIRAIISLGISFLSFVFIVLINN